MEAPLLLYLNAVAAAQGNADAAAGTFCLNYFHARAERFVLVLNPSDGFCGTLGKRLADTIVGRTFAFINRCFHNLHPFIPLCQRPSDRIR